MYGVSEDLVIARTFLTFQEGIAQYNFGDESRKAITFGSKVRGDFIYGTFVIVFYTSTNGIC